MRRVLLVPAMVAITATLLAQSSIPSAGKVSDDSASAPCTVGGRVMAAADGNPLKSARVALLLADSHSHHQIFSTTSDADGHFTIKDIPAGRYRFFATHTGFVEQDYKAENNEARPVFSLRPGEKVSDVGFRLVAAAVITGRVSNEDGDGMQRVQVVALRRPTEEETEDIDALRPRKIQMRPVASAESDDRGQYRIFGLKPGEYYIRAEDSSEPSHGLVPMDESFWLTRSLGSEYASAYYPGAAQLSQAQVIPIKAGEEAQADVVMHRVKTVEVAGHVIGGNGPSANAFVRLEPVDGNDSAFDRQDNTDEKGSFRLRNIPEGSYYILVYQKQEGTRMYESRTRQRVEVGGENIDSLTIALGVGAAIQGRVKFDGASSAALDRTGLTLISVDEDGQSGGYGDIKKDGTFEMRNVPDGNYSLSIWGLELSSYVKSIRCGPDNVLEKGVQVEGGSTAGKIEVIISSDGAQLEGSVSDGDGPVIGATVRVLPDPLTPYNRIRIRRSTTDQLGHFSLTDVAPGKYRISARPMASSEGTSYKSEPQLVTLSENDHKTIEVKLEKQSE